MVLLEAGLLVAGGIAAGVALTVLLGRGADALLFGPSPIDATTFAMAPALLAVIALAASAVPAMRASRVDPMLALRHD